MTPKQRLAQAVRRRRGPLVAVLRLAGVIGRLGGFGRGLALADLTAPIERAFRMRGVKAVALAINSPGGSAVQSALIAGRIRSLADELDVPVYAFAEDVAASGGYWLACAADEIHAEAASMIGSIGVVSAGFGFQDAMRRLGIERRLHTSGARKSMLDPFRSEDADDVERLGAIHAEVHEDFKEWVRRRRASRLSADEETLFSGEFWTGRRALEMGLIDGIGDMRTVLRQRFGEHLRLRPVGVRRSWLGRRLRLTGWGAPHPFDWAAGAMAAVEERLWWGRFGL